LLLRKGISWTRIFSDLEKTLPANVRVTQIRPQVNNNNKIYLEMTIASDSPEPLVTFLSNLEQSSAFGSANVSITQSPTQTDPIYRYRLSVNYDQKF
jgi:Tfp pilus assembly protein PilN